MPSTEEKRAAFHKLHDNGCFVLPNPWDVGSAKALQGLGFKALASTSAGFAWSIGKADNRVTLDNLCGHLSALCAAVDLPINADFENGFADEPEGVAAHVSRAAKTGIAGLSIEDATGDKARPLMTSIWRSSASAPHARPSMPIAATSCWSAVVRLSCGGCPISS